MGKSLPHGSDLGRMKAAGLKGSWRANEARHCERTGKLLVKVQLQVQWRPWGQSADQEQWQVWSGASSSLSKISLIIQTMSKMPMSLNCGLPSNKK